MTAVAPPLSFQPNSRLGWSNPSSNSGNGFSVDDSAVQQRMFAPSVGNRKAPTRSNSSSSLASSVSSNGSAGTFSSTQSGPQSNGSSTSASPIEAGNWAARKKAGGRALWPPVSSSPDIAVLRSGVDLQVADPRTQGKAEPATALSTARPQAVSSASSGPTASSAMTALHAPMLPQQQMANGNGAQINGAGIMQRHQAGPVQGDLPPAVLHLLPMNGTFERKAITVPYHPDVLRIGRQTNAKTIPTPHNGFFDSKVLSRQHAEIYAEPTSVRQANGYGGATTGARVFIRDVKSSNGTFVNGVRLSPENKESEPRELREQDVLELGIDIVSEDQKTVVHHKVAAKVEHAGVYGQSVQGQNGLDFGDLDPSGGGLMGGVHQPIKRSASQGSIGSVSSRSTLGGGGNSGAGVNAIMNGGMGMGMGQGQQMRNWLNPITTEHIMKKLNSEIKLAMQHSQDLARTRQAAEGILGNPSPSPVKDKENRHSASEKIRLSPVKSRTDLKALSFTEPPAPPPQAPLPEKPDVARALADPVIQPLLRRNDTARPVLDNNNSPTRGADHSSDILRLCEELKYAKTELSAHQEKLKFLEDQLAKERAARETSDKELAVLREESKSQNSVIESSRKQLSEVEAERNQARESLQEMIEKRRQEARDSSSQTLGSPNGREGKGKKARGSTGAASGDASPSSPLSPSRANGNLEGKADTSTGLSNGNEALDTASKQPVDAADRSGNALTKAGQQRSSDQRLQQGWYYGPPMASAAGVLFLGVVVMTWLNSSAAAPPPPSSASSIYPSS
ncbi:hypothetical protein K431DRAFT_132082 [Polychaeton citri CBS 116435]|uniref:FHA domain-containing protein n=1 Tax=Polychaeton citri CBS 116435 TaxID=1314669 RepID=A0A9P4QFL9_9PEZI|nr:hypothetical protein K431DRAFT_132082 [Polychaeton citri CBS 116435]